MSWSTEKLFFEGDAYFESLLAGVGEATASVELESYIFELDSLGHKVLAALEQAARRGVSARLMVDGFGSLGSCEAIRKWLKGSGVRLHVYHPVRGPGRAPLGAWMARLNRRNHRKTCIVDGRRAWVGSFNISHVHCRNAVGPPPWRDTGVCVSGPEVELLRKAFEAAWNPHHAVPASSQAFQLVRLNQRHAARRANFDDYLHRIAQARKRVWLTTPYFVPSHRLVQALEKASSAGADVRLLIPSRSDVPGMPSVAAAFFQRLLPAGVGIYLYRPAILHAKTSIIDDWALVGSSNLNHRSLLHDLEVDLVLRRHSSLVALERSFAEDLSQSQRIDPKRGTALSTIERSIGRLGIRFRRWL